MDRQRVRFETLNKIRDQWRSVPVPPVLIEHLDLAYALRQHQFKPQLDERLWQYSRVTAWRKIKPILDDSGIKFPLAVPNSYFSLASGKF